MRDLFEKPLTDITFEDIERLACSDAEEGFRLEFKRELPAKDGQRDPWMLGQRRIGNPAKDDLAKEIVAFANAYGGLVVVGIDETDDNPKRANGLWSQLIPNVADCAEQLRQSLQQIIDPPLPMLEVAGIAQPNGNGSGAVLIRTGLSPRAPHGFRSPPLVYVRRSSHSEPLGMRDIQAMFFETRTRAERIAARQKERAQGLEDLRRQLITGGVISRYSGRAVVVGPGSLAFRCTLIPTDDIGFHLLPELVRQKGFPRPDSIYANNPIAPAFGSGPFVCPWTPRPRGAVCEDAGGEHFSRWFLGTDGMVEAMGMRWREAHYPGWYAFTAAQLMIMAERLRRTAGRPDVEYVLDCQFLNYEGNVKAAVTGLADWNRVSEVLAGSIDIGPFSAGPSERFGQAFDQIEREIWYGLGLYPDRSLDVAFDQACSVAE
jgi:hypothetical protein